MIKLSALPSSSRCSALPIRNWHLILSILSGAIESANKCICQGRLKKSGAWWYITDSNNILKLRCAQFNGTYDRLIEKYKQIDRKRIYLEKYNNKLNVVK